MSILVLDQHAIDKLRAVSEGVQIRDERDALVGYFQPAVTPESVYQYECPLSEEELARIADQEGGRPLADILSDLRKRA